jgi:VWFA-related protein
MPLPCLRLLTAAVALAVLPALAGQPPGQPASQQPVQEASPPSAPVYTLTRNVRLVVLDAVVLDAKGNPVTDLQQSDFHIAEDGEPQTIRDFEAPGRYTPPPAVTIDSTADLDRLAPRAPVNIVLLDEFNTHFDDMAFARYSLKSWLEKQPAKLDTPTMLIAVSLEKFTVLRDYTQSKEEILKALDHHFVVDPWQLRNGSWLSERYSTALVSLRRVSEAVIGHPGHKTMIWVGRGFPTLNLAKMPTDDQTRLHSAVQQTIDQLRDARVTLYTIDPAGVMFDASKYDEGSPGDFQGSLAPFGGNPDFAAIASATGGRNLYGRNDVDREIGTSIRDGSSFYSFSYRPTNPTTSAMKFRRIKVVVDRPGLAVVTRQGYYPDLGAPRLN